jgi:hypothetical protein
MHDPRARLSEQHCAVMRVFFYIQYHHYYRAGFARSGAFSKNP